jgi:hypothetical protein
MKKIRLLVLLFFLVGFLFVGCEELDEVDTKGDPQLYTTPSNIYSEYRNNSIAVETKYVGKWVAVTGNVYLTSTNSDKYTIWLNGPNSFVDSDAVTFWFSKTKENQSILGSITKGQTLTIIGYGSNAYGSPGVLFDKCYIK